MDTRARPIGGPGEGRLKNHVKFFEYLEYQQQFITLGSTFPKMNNETFRPDEYFRSIEFVYVRISRGVMLYGR
jgi:hypothetical protein